MPKNKHKEINARINDLEKESCKLKNIISRDIRITTGNYGQVAMAQKLTNENDNRIAKLKNQHPVIYEAALRGEVEYMTTRLLFCKTIGCKYKMWGAENEYKDS